MCRYVSIASEINVTEGKYCTCSLLRKPTMGMCNLVSCSNARIKNQAANGLSLSLMDQTHM